MLNAKREYDWTQVAFSTATIANCWLGKGQSLKLSDFPYMPKPQEAVMTPELFKSIGAMIIGSPPKNQNRK